MGYKHLVILGAGSTIATIPEGDKNGMKSFTLDNLLTDPYFSSFVTKLNPKYNRLNVEQLCERLNKENIHLYNELVSLIRTKYAKLELPDNFTILERLIMSLKADDAIVSFNWDDLLIQAYQRVNIPEEKLPHLCFPHGNAQAGFNNHRYGSKRDPKNKYLKNSPLNMPINRSDYKENIFINSQWRILDYYIKSALMITFFGYSGPISDQNDIQHLEQLFSENKICTKIEIIDKSKESATSISQRWDGFIKLTENKPDLCGSFFESRIARFPRRTIESLDNWVTQKKVEIEDKSTFKKRIFDLMKLEQ